jgi:hypothetical protein
VRRSRLHRHRLRQCRYLRRRLRGGARGADRYVQYDSHRNRYRHDVGDAHADRDAATTDRDRDGDRDRHADRHGRGRNADRDADRLADEHGDDRAKPDRDRNAHERAEPDEHRDAYDRPEPDEYGDGSSLAHRDADQ